jgi:murein DD-endopeptidase MepM/ murein hydrolase activator NlpD
MERKNYTVILVPHARAKFRKFQVSNVHLWIVAATTALVIAGIATVAWTQFALPIDETQVASLREENEQLRKVNSTFEDGIRELQGKLDSYEERTRKLAIVAGIEEFTVSDETGIGGTGFGLETGLEGLDAVESELDRLTETLTTVESRFAEQARWAASVPSVYPAEGLLTSGFGTRNDPINGRRAMHQGVDISALRGKPVYATADGLVVRSGRLGHLGNAVYLSHGYGLTTRYGHMSKVAVEAGQKVHRGDVIGYVGSTGRSTGYHLHYEVREDGRPVNPRAYMLDHLDPLDHLDSIGG